MTYAILKNCFAQLKLIIHKLASLLLKRSRGKELDCDDYFSLCAMLARLGWYSFAMTAAKRVSKNIEYQFDDEDLRLHLLERNWTMPKLKVDANLGRLTRVSVGDDDIYWPSGLPTAELAWLYCEIFNPFANNPSSYCHKSIPYEHLPWVVDGGACEGFFTMHCLRQGIPRILAVEMQPDLIESLNATFSKKDTVEIIPFALSNGKQDLFVRTGSFACDSRATSISTSSSSAIVQSASLDMIHDEYKLTGRGLIKLDVEGAEMDALGGATQLLSKEKPYLAVAVYHGYDNALECEKIIKKANPHYEITFRGCYGYFHPPRPYMLFAF